MLPRLVHKHCSCIQIADYGWMSVIRNLYFFLIATLALACSSAPHQNVDELNDLSYAFHYRQLDSVSVYAQRALKQCKPSDDGYAEACNNMAFVATMRMDYDGAVFGTCPFSSSAYQ